MAKQGGGRWLLRLDDLDSRRQQPGMADDIMRTLASFGLLWDGEVTRQSRHLEEYEAAFGALQRAGEVYPCSCSRREISGSSSAPHPGDDGPAYPGRCRGGMNDSSPVRSWRVSVPEEEICFTDRRRGECCQRLPAVCGDFVAKRGDGEFAYQLAVVVDDALAGVNQVVRGDDLLGSTPRQIYLQRLLDFPRPDYCHLPLVTGEGGAKLSKRDNLISNHLGSVAGREQVLLLAALRFLGQKPPPELSGEPCSAILQWGSDHFRPERLFAAVDGTVAA